MRFNPFNALDAGLAWRATSSCLRNAVVFALYFSKTPNCIIDIYELTFRHYNVLLCFVHIV